MHFILIQDKLDGLGFLFANSEIHTHVNSHVSGIWIPEVKLWRGVQC